MSGVLSKFLAYLVRKESCGMTDREAKAWAEVDVLRQDLAREQAKVRWLCRQLESRDTMYNNSAESWEALADLYSGEKADDAKRA